MSDAIKEFRDKVSSKDRQWPKLVPLSNPKDDAMRSALIELFLSQRVRTWRHTVQVAIVFNTEIEAEEFHKLLKKMKRMERI